MENSQNSPAPLGPRTVQLPAEEAARIQSQFMTRVYGWMAAALGITGGVALFASSSVALQQLVFGNRLVFLGLLLLELVIVGFLSARALRWTPAQVTAAWPIPC